MSKFNIVIVGESIADTLIQDVQELVKAVKSGFADRGHKVEAAYTTHGDNSATHDLSDKEKSQEEASEDSTPTPETDSTTETKTYSDGAVATGTAPLPKTSPEEPAAEVTPAQTEQASA